MIELLQHPAAVAYRISQEDERARREEGRRKFEETMSEIAEYQQGISHALGLTVAEYKENLYSENFKPIFTIALLHLISWDKAEEIYSEAEEFFKQLEQMREDKLDEDIDLLKQEAGTRYSLPKVKERRVGKLLRNNSYRSKAGWREKITESKSWQIAAEAFRLGIGVSELIAMMINTQPPDEADLFGHLVWGANEQLVELSNDERGV